MIRTIEDLQKAIADIPEDNIIYVKNWNGYLFDICCVDDATSVGFWELKLSDTCTAYPGLSQMQSKQYDPKYIERCNKKYGKYLMTRKNGMIGLKFLFQFKMPFKLLLMYGR